MATSGTVSFNLSIEEIIEDAYERCGGQARAGYDLKSARRSLNILLSEWGNRGLHFWEVGNVNMALNEIKILIVFIGTAMQEQQTLLQELILLKIVVVIIFIMQLIF